MGLDVRFEDELRAAQIGLFVMAITAFSARLAERWQPDRWAGLSQRALGLQWTNTMIYGCLINLSPPERPSPKRNSRGSDHIDAAAMKPRTIQHVW